MLLDRDPILCPTVAVSPPQDEGEHGCLCPCLPPWGRAATSQPRRSTGSRRVPGGEPGMSRRGQEAWYAERGAGRGRVRADFPKDVTPGHRAGKGQGATG